MNLSMYLCVLSMYLLDPLEYATAKFNYIGAIIDSLINWKRGQ